MVSTYPHLKDVLKMPFLIITQSVSRRNSGSGTPGRFLDTGLASGIRQFQETAANGTVIAPAVLAQAADEGLHYFVVQQFVPVQRTSRMSLNQEGCFHRDRSIEMR